MGDVQRSSLSAGCPLGLDGDCDGNDCKDRAAMWDSTAILWDSREEIAARLCDDAD